MAELARGTPLGGGGVCSAPPPKEAQQPPARTVANRAAVGTAAASPRFTTGTGCILCHPTRRLFTDLVADEQR